MTSNYELLVTSRDPTKYTASYSGRSERQGCKVIVKKIKYRQAVLYIGITITIRQLSSPQGSVTSSISTVFSIFFSAPPP